MDYEVTCKKCSTEDKCRLCFWTEQSLRNEIYMDLEDYTVWRQANPKPPERT